VFFFSSSGDGPYHHYNTVIMYTYIIYCSIRQLYVFERQWDIISGCRLSYIKIGIEQLKSKTLFVERRTSRERLYIYVYSCGAGCILRAGKKKTIHQTISCVFQGDCNATPSANTKKKKFDQQFDCTIVRVRRLDLFVLFF